MERIGLRALLALSLFLIAACGGGEDGDTSAASSPDATEETEETAADEGGDRPESCPDALPFDVEVRSEGDSERETMTVVDAIGLQRADGRAWTVYLADFDIPDDTSWNLVVPEVPSGGTLVTTGLDTFNAPDFEAVPVLEVGDGGGLFREVGDGATATFLNVATAAGASGSVNQTGTSELLYLDDDTICLTVSITSESGLELVGTYAAFELVEI